MKINHSLAVILRDFLKLNSGDHKTDEINYFSKDELELITELRLNNLDNLDDLDKLPNLKKLTIESENYNNFASYINLKNNPLLNRINDFTPIEKLSSLEELKIINDINVKKIDLIELKNLRKIYLINNPNLSTVKNLDKLKKLEKIIIYGTSINSDLNIEDYIVNTYKAKTNILDISMYHSLVKGEPKKSKELSKLYKLGFTNIEFAEKTGFADFARLSPDKVNAVYIKCYDIIKTKQLHEMSDYNKIKQVYEYVIKNITFDNEGIIARDRKFLESNYNYNKIPPHLKNDFSMLHSSYNASILKKSNCEGYVNLMNFILQMLNIKTASVYATNKANKNIASYNHALTSVNFEGKWYYCEPSWEKPSEFKYFMKTYDEISESHILNPLELLKNKEVKHNAYNDERNRKY